ncbi:uncharacterized protein TNCV_4942571 [Trichonephila clavipes]|nr:uncharacterized protein TNCV_4942571 [Trichonephila clavipes]
MRPTLTRKGLTRSKDVTCCSLGHLAGDKGYHCVAKFYAARIVLRNQNRAHNRKLGFHGRYSVPNYGTKLMRTFEQCVATRGMVFHKCCNHAAVEKKGETAFRHFTEEEVRNEDEEDSNSSNIVSKLNFWEQQPMRAKVYSAHLSISDHWALRCMSGCPDQRVQDTFHVPIPTRTISRLLIYIDMHLMHPLKTVVTTDSTCNVVRLQCATKWHRVEFSDEKIMLPSVQ